MSHFEERAEKICLNCNASIHGRFCHICGQQNIEPKESFWHLVTHFVYDIIHFDGMFFSTAKYLLFRPGFLSLEYLRGRRASYLNPIRMYIFVSAFFFLIFFSFFKPKSNIIQTDTDTVSQSSSTAAIQAHLLKKKQALETAVAAPMIETARKKMQGKIALLNSDLQLLEKDSTQKARLQTIDKDISKDPPSPASQEAYDAAQQKLPASERDDWFQRQLEKKRIDYRKKYGNDELLQEHLIEKFLHSFPQLLFLSLPLVALILQLLYIRRKQYYYVNHLIYTLHLYCAIFIILFCLLLLSGIDQVSWLRWTGYLEAALWLSIVWYIYLSMRRFYGQGRGKTMLKLFCLGMLSFWMIVLLFVGFFFFSILTV